MPEQERVAIFIDGSNFYHSLKHTFFIRDNVDFKAVGFSSLINKILAGRLLIGVYYYNAPLDWSRNPDIYSKQQRFFEDLKKLPGWHVVLCRLRKDKDGKYTVKGDDIHLAVDMVSLAYENAFDTAILISGDGDFVPAVERLKKLGKQVENAYFHVSSSEFLKQICDSSALLDSIIADILKQKK